MKWLGRSDLACNP